MNIFKSIVVTGLLLFLVSACASDGTETDAAENQVAQTEPDTVCRTERETGKLIPRKRCWSREDYDAMVKDSEDKMRRMNTTQGSGGDN